MADVHESVPYIEVTSPDFAVSAEATFKLCSHVGGIESLRGPCPRCRGEMESPVVTEIYRRFGIGKLFRRSGTGPERDPVEVLVCSCEYEHDGRPDGEIGCGAYWMLRIQSESS
ncbi:hypothetical protein [Nocardia sp. IFM 10818]